MKTQINGFELMELGFPEGKIIGIALKINSKRHGLKRDEMITNFKSVLETPENYTDDAIFSKLAIA
jgi:tRNA-splicing ligase RtcB